MESYERFSSDQSWILLNLIVEVSFPLREIRRNDRTKFDAVIKAKLFGLSNGNIGMTDGPKSKIEALEKIFENASNTAKRHCNLDRKNASISRH